MKQYGHEDWDEEGPKIYQAISGENQVCGGVQKSKLLRIYCNTFWFWNS